MSDLLQTSNMAGTSAGGDDFAKPDQATPTTAPVQTTGLGRRMRYALSWLPSLLVATALGAIAWYGHGHDWKLPKFSLTSAPHESETAWCDSHGVPEEQCIVCLPDLMGEAAVYAFCKEHGVHGCVFCNPSLAETKRPIAATANDLARAERALKLRPRTENLAIGSTPGTRIQFASRDALQKAGVDVEPVQRRRMVELISAAGEVRYDATKTAQVSPQSDGIVRRVFAEVGDWVSQGEVLALIDSTAAGQLKSELLAALADQRLQYATVQRLRPLAGLSVSEKRLDESESDFLQASAAVDRVAGALGNLGLAVDLPRLRQMKSVEARTYVHDLGLDRNLIEAGPDHANAKNLIAVVSPIEGQITERTATIGQVVDRGTKLFDVVDTRRVWLDLRVAGEEASLVKLGLPVRFLPDGDHRDRIGTVTWVSSDVDAQTRTVRVRAELANDDQNLRHQTFGRGQIVLRDEPDAIVVPESAVQWDGAGQVVFVRDAHFFEADRPKFFISRSVRIGVSQDGFAEVIAGVLPGEVVAAAGSDVLRAQLLRSNLGAGCTCGR
ncbi:MAG: efflux RND transporter periplasmic adaptor subunit [Pirellulales bacterium]|nr:efflux RND transporter periplasmic adaptor subunit [Pirellulales bacterium]